MQKDENLIRIVSFNLKSDFLTRSKNKWANRRSLAAKVIKDSGAAIIGVQELLPHMRKDVGELLDMDYSILGFGRFSGRKPHKDEHSDIIIKNSSADVRLIKTFWLSKNPEEISRAYYAFFPRICTVAEVHLKEIDRTIRVFNTHFDHICGLARKLGAKVILEYMQKFNQQRPMPTILMGDLNAKPHSKAVRYLREHNKEYPDIHLTDVYSALHCCSVGNTLHHFNGKIKVGAPPIDYIFVSDEFEVVDSKIITDPVEGKYPSDHYPLLATLRLKEMPLAHSV